MIAEILGYPCTIKIQRLSTGYPYYFFFEVCDLTLDSLIFRSSFAMAICHFSSKVQCFSGHLTCATKNVKKGRAERKEEEKAGGWWRDEGRGGQEKHFEAERKFRVGVIDVFGGCVPGLEVVAGGNPESSLKGQMRNTFRSGSEA